MNNKLVINTNKKRINLLKKQIENAEQSILNTISIEEVDEIKKDISKLIMALYFTPVTIMLLISSLISITFLLETTFISIGYFILLAPIQLNIDKIVDRFYRKQLDLRLDLETLILEKENEISELIQYNRCLEIVSKENVNLKHDEIINDKQKTYAKKK